MSLDPPHPIFPHAEEMGWKHDPPSATGCVVEPLATKVQRAFAKFWATKSQLIRWSRKVCTKSGRRFW
jgi:hypothetical protein